MAGYKEQQQNGIVLKCIGGFYYVEAADAVYECRARGILRHNGVSPVAGDRVAVDTLEDGTGTLKEVLERKNVLVRPPVANVDVLVIVVSTVDPVPNFLILDKMTAIAEYKHIEPVLVVTKTDLKGADDITSVYEKTGLNMWSVSAKETESSSLTALKRYLGGKTCVFTGNSGVGKSSLLNILQPSLVLQTGETSQKLGRGRHTTRATSLYPFGNGGYIVDTPGFSSLDMEKMEIIMKEDLAGCFREFSPYLGKCRFTSCSHTKEKGCAVLEAVETGIISRSRHDSYVTMYTDVKDRKEWEFK